MKIFTLIKIFGISTVLAGGITAAVVFSNLNTITFPTVRILTKSFYNDIKVAQMSNPSSSVNNGVSIDYYSLPGTNYTTFDVASGIKKNYMFFYGSEAYATTTKALYGWNGGFASSQGESINYANSLMLNLYDLFLTDNQKAKDYGVDKVNPIFLNYIDTCSTKEIIENERLFYNRFSVMGDQNAGGSKNPVANKSREWIVNGDDVLNTTYEPVVKGADKFLYEPAANSYEFRPNNLADTQYEQVFFRDQNVVNQWNQVGDFFTNFFSSKQDGSISFNKEGTLLCAKYENNNWSFKSITSFDNVENQIVDIVKFYNPDYVDPNQQEPTPTPPTEETPPSSDGTTPPSDGTTDTTTPPPARANLKQTNKILVDDKNVKLVNNQYLINKKVD